MMGSSLKDGYRYQDGKVLVTDYSNGNERDIQIRHYQDNIDEILITENILEKLDSEYGRVIDIYNEDNMELAGTKSEISMAFLSVGMLTILIGGILSLVLSGIGIKPLITLIVFFITSLGLTYKFSIKSSIERIKELKKQLKGEDFTIEAIEKEIEKNQKILKELQDDISRSKLDDSNDNMNSIQKGDYIQLDYVGKLKELREYIGLCYVMGYSHDDLSRWYDEKTLNEVIENKEQVKVLKREFLDKMKNR